MGSDSRSTSFFLSRGHSKRSKRKVCIILLKAPNIITLESKVKWIEQIVQSTLLLYNGIL